MYEAHFGLKSRPFGSKAEGADVFSGPRQVETMTNLRKGLTALDAVVAVTGPAGVGKTTLVSRALDTITPNRMAAWVGRMPLAPDEVLHLLLAGFGVKQPAKSTIQRFAVFRRLLAERAAAGAPVAIVVEDAHRIGVDALAELEALTAADTGDATGANIILMGQPDLKALLAKPELARLNQRTRLRQAIEPFSQPEANGYLKHCIRGAGGNYDEIFDAGVAEIVYSCSEGIPRMMNTLCESALTTAMEDGLTSVSTALMHKVAVDAFGYEGPIPENPADVPSEDSVAVPVVEVKAEGVDETGSAADEPEIDWEAPPAPDADETTAANSDDELPPSARNIVVESGRFPELPENPEDSPLNVADESVAEPETASAAEAVADAAAEPDLPELINDTQPELSTLNVPESDEPAVEVLDVDIESTAIQEQLPVQDIPQLEPEPEAEITENIAASNDAAAANGAAGDGAGKANDENFDLDAVLSIETDSTNVMEGITPNLDELAADAETRDAEEDVSSPDLDDLPTLTDSMQVDVEKEAKRTKQADQEPDHAATHPQLEAIVRSSEPDTPIRAANSRPAESDEPVAATKPEPAAKVAPEPVAAADPEPDLAEMVLEPDLPIDLASDKPAKKATPVAQVSEMTARIAAIDPNDRSNDVDALEAALDAAKTGTLEAMMAPPPLPQEDSPDAVMEDAEPVLAEANGLDPVAEEAPSPLPEITLDEAIERKPAPRPIPDEHVAGIRKANSLEEFSDAMAETLFGNEDFDQIAAAVVANPPPDIESTEQAVSGEPDPALADVAALDAELSLAAEDVAPEPAAPPPVSAEDGGLRESQQIRADLLKSLKSDSKPAAGQPAGNKPPAPDKAGLVAKPSVEPASPKGPEPESIENQINTSMTQTLEALNVAKMAEQAGDETEEKEEKKGGLFSRFRKSS